MIWLYFLGGALLAFHIDYQEMKKEVPYGGCIAGVPLRTIRIAHYTIGTMFGIPVALASAVSVLVDRLQAWLRVRRSFKRMKRITRDKSPEIYRMVIELETAWKNRR